MALKLSTFLIFVVLLGCTRNAQALTQISNCRELQAMEDGLLEEYELVSDIDCSDTLKWNNGTGFDPIGTLTASFRGSFKGKGFLIHNITIYKPSADYVGLFGIIGATGKIDFLAMEQISILGRDNVGGLVGDNRGVILNSYARGTVVGTTKVGGLVGYNLGGVIMNSFSDSVVSAPSGAREFIGGLVGYNAGAGTLSNVYAKGEVSGRWAVGGLLGYGTDSNIINAYSASKVYGIAHLGGLVGEHYGVIISAYWDVEASGVSSYSSAAIGKTTAEMKQQGGYAGWDFDGTWTLDPDHTYPVLQVFVLPPLLSNPLIDRVHNIGELLVFTLPADSFTEPNGLRLRYSVQLVGGLPLPAWLFFTPVTQTFAGTPLSGAQGALNIEVTAHNTPSQFVVDTFTLHVMNRAPVVQAPMIQQIASNLQFFQYIIPEATFFDGDGDRLMLSAASENAGPLPAWLDFNAGLGIFSGTPTQRASVWINVTVRDDFGGSASDLVEIVTPNSAPQVEQSFPNQVVRLRQLFSFSVPTTTFSDLDKDPLTYSANLFGGGELLGWMTFDSQTLTFEGMPDVLGFVTLSVVAMDTYNASVFMNFGLSVSDIAGNSAPVLVVKIPSQSTLTGKTYDFTFSENTFEDPNGDPLAYTATQEGGASLPEWLAFTDDARTFYGVPDHPEVLRLTVRADDGRSGYALDTFTLTIEDATNYPPVVLNPLSNQVASVGQLYRFTVPDNTFNDVNDDTLVFTAFQAGNRSLPDWLTFEPDTRTFSGKPGVWDTNIYGDKQHTIEVRASDQVGSAVTTFYLFVEGESFWEIFIKAVAPVVGIASTCITIYLNRAALWNIFCKRCYWLPRQIAIADRLYEWKIELPKFSKGKRVKRAQAFTSNGEELPNDKRLPDWLQHYPKQTPPSISGMPSEKDCESLILRFYGYDERILAEFKFAIVATEADAAELDLREMKTSRGKSILMHILPGPRRGDRSMSLLDDAEE